MVSLISNYEIEQLTKRLFSISNTFCDKYDSLIEILIEEKDEDLCNIVVCLYSVVKLRKKDVLDLISKEKIRHDISKEHATILAFIIECKYKRLFKNVSTNFYNIKTRHKSEKIKWKL